MDDSNIKSGKEVILQQPKIKEKSTLVKIFTKTKSEDKPKYSFDVNFNFIISNILFIFIFLLFFSLLIRWCVIIIIWSISCLFFIILFSLIIFNLSFRHLLYIFLNIFFQWIWSFTQYSQNISQPDSFLIQQLFSKSIYKYLSTIKLTFP